MLKVKKVMFDAKDNINMSFNHYGYAINITSKPYYPERLLDNYGVRLVYKSQHYDYERTKKFDERCYKSSAIKHLFEEEEYENDWNYFIASTSTLKDIPALLNKQIYIYNTRILITKFGICLSEVYTKDIYDGIDSPSNQEAKHVLVHSINELIEIGYGRACVMENRIFNRSIPKSRAVNL